MNHSELRQCPICKENGISPRIETCSVFVRCQRCNQAISMDENGKMGPWLNVWKAGSREARMKLRKKGNRR